MIQGLNKKLTRLDKVRSDLRIVSDKLSDTLATTTIGTAQKVGEGKVQATLAAAELRDATAAQREKSIEMLRIKRAELQAQFGIVSVLHLRKCLDDTPLTDNGMIGNRTGQFLKLSLKLKKRLK